MASERNRQSMTEKMRGATRRAEKLTRRLSDERNLATEPAVHGARFLATGAALGVLGCGALATGLTLALLRKRSATLWAVNGGALIAAGLGFTYLGGRALPKERLEHIRDEFADELRHSYEHIY